MSTPDATIFVNARALVEREGADGAELLIQRRDRAGEARTCLELPGGRIEPFEPLLDALRREVFEETGLRVVSVEGERLRQEDHSHEATVECVQPFCAYQTTRGPVDSMGLYFRCEAEGTLLKQGDDTRDIRWVGVRELARMLRDEPEAFCWVDRCGVHHYLQQVHGSNTRL